VTPLAHLPQLRRVTLSRNQIVSAAPLREMPALAMLNIAQNRVADAHTFAGFATLEELWVGGNRLTDVTPLAALPALTGVDFEGTDSGSLMGLDVLRARKVYVGGFA
jgi:internalin A